MWTSPVLSHDGFKYYVLFVDHFNKHIWLYPLKYKSDVHEVFIQLKTIVEKYFDCRIISLYIDNGGKYQSLDNYRASQGISHLTTLILQNTMVTLNVVIDI